MTLPFLRHRAPIAQPKIFRALTAYLQLEPTTAQVWWHALCCTQWSVPIDWRRRLLLFEQRNPGSVDVVMAFWMHSLSPAEVMAVTEDLRRERRLTSELARTIEEHICTRLTRDGAWQ